MNGSIVLNEEFDISTEDVEEDGQDLLAFAPYLEPYKRLLAQAANGEVDRSREAAVIEAEEKIVVYLRRKLEIGTHNFPAAKRNNFWKTRIGRILAGGQKWLYGHEWIDMPTAACILRDLPREAYKDNQDVRGYMKTKTDNIDSQTGYPYLTQYYDPTPGLRYPLRVRRSQVLALKDRPSW